MGIRLYKGGKNSRKHRSGSDFKDLTRGRPEKSLTQGLKKQSARNNKGRITVRHHGGGHKRAYRLIDFKRGKLDVPAKVFSIEYDPNRTCRIALVHYVDGDKSYILAPAGLKKGDTVQSHQKKALVRPGDAFPLELIPTGVLVHNIEVRPGKGGQLARSAGAQATVSAHLGKYCQLKMPSGESRLVLSKCRASIGSLSNAEHENIRWGKAGRSRWRGKRPGVRGMAMNPVDHPLGGGEGVGKGNHPMTPWGKYCKGLKTRNNPRTDFLIINRRKKRK